MIVSWYHLPLSINLYTIENIADGLKAQDYELIELFIGRLIVFH